MFLLLQRMIQLEHFYLSRFQGLTCLTYIESELKAIETQLKPAKTNEYGRVDAAAAWALLAKLYLNAEVYTGTPKYTEAVTYCNKVIAVAGYSLINLQIPVPG